MHLKISIWLKDINFKCRKNKLRWGISRHFLVPHMAWLDLGKLLMLSKSIATTLVGHDQKMSSLVELMSLWKTTKALDSRVHSDLKVEVVISSHLIKIRKTRNLCNPLEVATTKTISLSKVWPKLHPKTQQHKTSLLTFQLVTHLSKPICNLCRRMMQ